MPTLAPATNITASPSPSHVFLKWTCPADATGFDVLATTPEGHQITLTKTPISVQCIQDLSASIRRDPRLPGPNTTSYSTSYRHEGLRPGRQYAYVVRTLYPNGAADAGPVAAVTPPWPAPTGVHVKVQSTWPAHAATVVVAWNPVAGAPGYEVYRTYIWPDSPDQRITPTPITAATFTDSSPIGAKGYYVKTVDGLATQPVLVVW